MKRLLVLSLRYFKRLDKLLLLLCMTASGFCALLLYSMYQNGINPMVISPRAWQMHIIYTAGSVALALIVAGINYKMLSKIWFTYAGVALLLSLLLFTPLGMSTPGSTEINWLNLGFMQVQPSEFLLTAFIMTFATHLYRVGDKLNHLPHVILLCLHVMIPVVIFTLQDNTGSSVMMLFIFLVMLFMAGISWKYILTGAIAIPAMFLLLWNFYFKPYHKMRILVIYDAEIQAQEMLGMFHQQHRSLVALGSGGLTGLGLSGGEYTTMFAIHNDFMFAYVGMTLGFVGCILTLLLLLIICIKILSVMSVARDNLGRYICAGTFALFFSHCVINVGMVTATLPVIGVPLPLISAGGSSTLALYIAIGLVMSVWMHREKKYHMFYTERD